MFISAYDTLACRAYNVKQIQSELRMAIVEDNTIMLETPSGKSIPAVFGLRPDNKSVPTFAHPIPVYINEKEDAPYFFVDTRSLVKANPNAPRGYSINNPTEYNFQIKRAALNLAYNSDPSSFMGLGDLTPLVFCRWLTDMIVRKLGLDPSDQVRVTTVTLFYWYSLFQESETETFTEKEKMRIITKLTQITSIPSSLSMEVIDSIPVIKDITEYVQTLQLVISNPRLDKLSPALLFAMIGNAWFGANAKEVAAVALEHPPTFVAMVATALDSRSFKKSAIGELVYLNDKKDRGIHFKKAFGSLLAGE